MESGSRARTFLVELLCNRNSVHLAVMFDETWNHHVNFPELISRDSILLLKQTAG